MNGELFIKRSLADPGKTYPDFGCSFEMFTSSEFLEMETLGPIQKVAADATVEHIERWTLHKNVKLKALTDAEIDATVAPLLGF